LALLPFLILLFHSLSLPHCKKSLLLVWVVVLGVCALIAGPFIYDVQMNPGAPEARFDQLGEIISELRQGNLKPLLKQTVATAGMLLVTGDPNWRYNISTRPTFGPIMGLLASAGLFSCLYRWRQPGCFVTIIWLLLGWAPSMLTPEAPSFVRAVGAIPPVVMLVGVGAKLVFDAVEQRFGHHGIRWALGILLLILVWNGATTFTAYFSTWPEADKVREIYQASLTEAFRALETDGVVGTVWVSEPFPDDRHLMLAERLAARTNLDLRWFDASRALILPPQKGGRSYLIADFAGIDPYFYRHWINDPVILAEGRNGTADDPAFLLYRVNGGPWVEQTVFTVLDSPGSSAFLDTDMNNRLDYPIWIGDHVTLYGYDLVGDRIQPGQALVIVLFWVPDGPATDPLVSFVHLLDESGQVIGQYDGFDVPPWHWESGSLIAQKYEFDVIPDLPDGTYWLEAGLYNSQTLERLPILDNDGTVRGDHIYLEMLVESGN
jgi:hypothetical protein